MLLVKRSDSSEEWSRAPVLVIGLDGGSWSVLDPLLQAGLMPNLARLRSEGCWGDLRSTIPPFTAPAWSTFMTGKDPGQHGVLSFFRQDLSSYAMMPGGPLATSAALEHPTVWQLLSEAGWRVGIINVPLTYPPRPLNGFLVSGLLTPIGASDFTYPSELAAELGHEYVIEPDYLRGIMGSFDLSQLPERDRLLADLEVTEATRIATTLRLVAAHRPDFTMVVLASTDRIAHFFWDCLENDVLASRGGDPHSALCARVRDHFRKLDDWIGRLRGAFGDDVTVLMMSDHGFGPAARYWAHVNSWLRAEGLLRLKAGGPASWGNTAYWKAHLLRLIPAGWIKSLLPQSARRAVRRSERTADLIDWSRTEAHFVLIYANVAGVVVNLRGRQPQGCVEPGPEYEAVRDRVIAAAREWRNPLTGDPVVNCAARREEVYHGDHVSDFPDVILELDPDFSAVATLPRGSVSRAIRGVRSGEHRSQGIFLAHGPAFRSGRVAGASIADLAPTLLHLAGEPVPSDMGGEVLVQAFEPDWLERHPVQDRVAPPDAASVSSQPVYTAEDEALLTRHLAGLGYL